MISSTRPPAYRQYGLVFANNQLLLYYALLHRLLLRAPITVASQRYLSTGLGLVHPVSQRLPLVWSMIPLLAAQWLVALFIPGFIGSQSLVYLYTEYTKPDINSRNTSNPVIKKTRKHSCISYFLFPIIARHFLLIYFFITTC